MSGKNFTDEEIISGIKSGGKKQTAVLSWIYDNPRYRNHSRTLCRSWKLSNDEQDIYQESVIELDKSISNNHFQLSEQHTVFKYWTGIHKNIRMKYQADHSKRKELMEMEPQENDSGRIYELLTKFSHIAPKCAELFRLIANGLTTGQISEKMNYSSVGVVRVTKLRCQKKLLDFLNNNI